MTPNDMHPEAVTLLDKLRVDFVDKRKKEELKEEHQKAKEWVASLKNPTKVALDKLEAYKIAEAWLDSIILAESTGGSN